MQEGQRVLVMEHTSDDWYVVLPLITIGVRLNVYLRWTGEIDGKRGLIPAAYVKML